MTPGKENFIYFEQLMRNQQQAPAYAVYVTDAIHADIKHHLAELSAIYKTVVTYDEVFDSCKDQRVHTFSMFMPWEVEHGVYIGTKMQVFYFVHTKTAERTVQVMMRRHHQPEDPFKSE